MIFRILSNIYLIYIPLCKPFAAVNLKIISQLFTLCNSPSHTIDHKETLGVNHSLGGITATLLVYSPLPTVVILILSYNLRGYESKRGRSGGKWDMIENYRLNIENHRKLLSSILMLG